MAVTNKSAKEIASKYGRNASAAVEDYKLGVQAVTEAPGMKAAKQQAKMRQNVIASIDSGDWAKKVSSVTNEEWKEKTLTKGAERYPSGVRGAELKMEQFMGKFIPHLQTINNELDAMPNLTLEDSIARASHQIRRAADFKNS